MADPMPVNPIPAPQPGGEFSFKQMLPTLVFDVAMPIVAFNLLTAYGVSTLWALVAGGLFPAINNLRVWAKSRRLEPLGIIVMTLSCGWNGGLADLGQRVLRADQGIVPDRDLRFHLPRLAARRAAADVLHRPAIRRRRRSGAARMVEQPLAVSQFSRRAPPRHRGVGNRLPGRSASQSRLCAGPLAGAGGGISPVMAFGVMIALDRMDAAIYARDARTADTRDSTQRGELNINAALD